MKIGVSFLAFVLFALFARPVGAVGPDRDREAIQETFQAARAALLGGNAPALLALASHQTRSRIEAIRITAQSGDPQRLSRLGPTDRLAAQSLRRIIPPNELHHLQTQELLRRAMAQNWLPVETINNAALGEPKLHGMRAMAPVLVNRRPTVVRADFLRETGHWRIDLTRLTTLTDAMISGAAAAGGKSEDDVIAELLAKVPEHSALGGKTSTSSKKIGGIGSRSAIEALKLTPSGSAKPPKAASSGATPMSIDPLRALGLIFGNSATE
ncbi:exported hypothetical protein [Azospirillaceae bacterium]